MHKTIIIVLYHISELPIVNYGRGPKSSLYRGKTVLRYSTTCHLIFIQRVVDCCVRSSCSWMYSNILSLGCPTRVTIDSSCLLQGLFAFRGAK